MVPGIAEGVDRPVLAHQPVPVVVRCRRHVDDRRTGRAGTERSLERRITEGEDPAVRGHHPVAPSVTGGGHAHDRLVEVVPPHRPLEGRSTEGEDPAVRGHRPVTPSVTGGRHTDHGRIEPEGARRAPEPGVAEGEDAAVGGIEPVPVPAGSSRHADHGLVQDGRRHVPVRDGIAEGLDGATVGDDPVPVPVRGERRYRTESVPAPAARARGDAAVPAGGLVVVETAVARVGISHTTRVSVTTLASVGGEARGACAWFALLRVDSPYPHVGGGWRARPFWTAGSSASFLLESPRRSRRTWATIRSCPPGSAQQVLPDDSGSP